MRVLVTGSTGFVGRALVPDLAAAGHEVHAVSRGDHGDLADGVDWRPLVAGMDAVVHLAGQAHAASELADEHYDRVNHRATAELAIACRTGGVRTLVFVSSIRAQTGPVATSVLDERSPAAPADAYGRSKLAAEAAIRAAGVAHTILRPVLIYGPELKGNLATLRRLAARRVPLPFGAFHNRRSLLALSGLCSAIDLALASPATQDQTFVVADRAPIELREIIAAFRAGAGRRPGLVPVPLAVMRAALRLAGGREMWERVGGELVVDPAKLIAAGWSPVDDTRAELARLAARE